MDRERAATRSICVLSDPERLVYWHGFRLRMEQFSSLKERSPSHEPERRAAQHLLFATTISVGYSTIDIQCCTALASFAKLLLGPCGYRQYTRQTLGVAIRLWILGS